MHSEPGPIVSIAGVAELTADEREQCADPIAANASAVRFAARDAGMAPRDIDTLLTYDSIVAPDVMQANRVADYLGISPSYASTVGSAGATPAFAVSVAADMIRSGSARTVAIAHSDLRASSASTAGVQQRMSSIIGNPEFESPFGPLLPTLYSFLADWMIGSKLATPHDLASIAVQIRDWAMLNPLARMRTELTVEEVLAAPRVAGALGRYDCCLITDFAGALIVTSSSEARAPVRILASAGTASHEEILQTDPDDPLGPARSTAEVLYVEAGLDASAIDVAHLYDSFSVTVALQLLAYNLDQGRGLKYLLSGAGVGPGGALPVNTHGGLMSATTSGLFHIAEAVKQLRGEAQSRQVPGARTALVTNVGGVFSNHAALILRGGGLD